MSQKRNKMTRSRGQRSTPFTYVPVNSRRVRLTYPAYLTMTESAVNGGVEKLYRLNGPYDVDPTLGSTSTPGFAEMAAIFVSCRVWSARVRVDATVTGGSTGSLANVILYPNSVNTFVGSAGSWLVAPYSIHKAVRADGTGGQNLVTLTKSYDLPSVARITKAQYQNEADYSSTVTSTPIKQFYCAVAITGIGSSTVLTCNATVWIQMDVEFFQPIQLIA